MPGRIWQAEVVPDQAGFRKGCGMSQRSQLNTLDDIRAYFTDPAAPPTYTFLARAAFLGMASTMSNLHLVTPQPFTDVSGAHCFTPSDTSDFVFPQHAHDAVSVGVAMTKYVLSHPEFADYVRRHGPGLAVFFVADDECTVLARQLGLTPTWPDSAVQHLVDSKIESVQLCDRLGIPAIPHIIDSFDGFHELRLAARLAGFGDQLVAQLPYGDGGDTTFFVSNAEDWHQSSLQGRVIKVMPRLAVQEWAVQGVVTRHGTIVDEPTANHVGIAELTTLQGGFCGSTVTTNHPDSASRRLLRRWTRQIGDAIGELGYRGTFGVDFLERRDTGELFAGEINPRLTGATPLANVVGQCSIGLPLTLFHLLEYSDVPYELDVEQVNDDLVVTGDWSLTVVRQTDPTPGRFGGELRQGVWQRSEQGTPTLVATGGNLSDLADRQVYCLPTRTAGYPSVIDDYLATLIMPGVAITDGRLSDDSRYWVDFVRAQYPVISESR